MSLLETTKRRMAELGISPKRSLGQNFLISESAVGKVIERTRRYAPQQIVEVGPGLGSLTDSLRTLGCPLHLIELDRQFAHYWRQQGLGVTEADALAMDWRDLHLPPGTVLVSNLPYQISTGLIVERTFAPQQVTAMVLMFQKEVAGRILGKPKTKAYGSLSVLMQTHWQIDLVLEAGPRDFLPAPQVASQVLAFARKPSPFSGREREFF